MCQTYQIKYLIIWLFIVGCFAASSSAQPEIGSIYAGDKVPGNPVNQVKVMDKIYEYTQIYRQRHEGNYPTDGETGVGSLLADFIGHLPDYGFKSSDTNLALSGFVNPDYLYGDGFANRQPRGIIITTKGTSLRPNGNHAGAPKPAGTRDILATTNIYFHFNSPDPTNGRKSQNPVGFYMALWDDGSIEKVPYDRVFYVPTTTTRGESFSIVYPTQAGIPWDCLSYWEMQTKSYSHTLATLPPIGFPLSPGQIDPKPDNGGIESLVWMTRLSGLNIMREPIWDSLGHQVKEFTLQEVADGAAKINFPLQQKVLSLDDLQKLHTPAMLYLSDAGRIVTMSSIDDNYAIIYDRGMTLNVPRAELAKRYSGNALIAASVNAPSSLVADRPIRHLEFSSLDAGVMQNIKITNNGTKPVSLLIERPLCGITEAKLSQDKIVPGATANLELHFKWRTILPGDHQSTFVTLKTDDPAQPRLQLGFELKLTEEK